MPLFSLIVCVIGLTLTENGSTINNQDRKESKFSQFCNL